MLWLKLNGNAIFRGEKCYGSSLLTGYSDDRAFAVNFVLVTNLNTGATKGGWDIPEVSDEMSRSSEDRICSKNRNDDCLALRCFLQIKFQHIPDEFVDIVVSLGTLHTLFYFWCCNLRSKLFAQVDQGDMTCVAGGLKLTHPSVQPFIKELVSNSSNVLLHRQKEEKK